jgi:alanine racemase
MEHLSVLISEFLQCEISYENALRRIGLQKQEIIQQYQSINNQPGFNMNADSDSQLPYSM